MTTITAPTSSAPTLTTPTTRSAADSARAFPNAVRSEWIKTTSVRSNAAIFGLAATVSGGITWAIANFVTDEVLTTAELFTFTTIFTAVFAAVGGILMIASESQHGTLAPTLTAQPSRSVIASSKVVIAAGYGALLGTVGMATAALGSWVGGVGMGDTSNMVADGGRALIYSALAAVLGLGVGMITRHSSAAISGLLVWWLVVENLILAFANEKYTRFMPFQAGNGLLEVSNGPQEGISDLALSTTQSGLVFGAYALGAVLIGTVLLHRRENN